MCACCVVWLGKFGAARARQAVFQFQTRLAAYASASGLHSRAVLALQLKRPTPRKVPDEPSRRNFSVVRGTRVVGLLQFIRFYLFL